MSTETTTLTDDQMLELCADSTAWIFDVRRVGTGLHQVRFERLSSEEARARELLRSRPPARPRVITKTQQAE